MIKKLISLVIILLASCQTTFPPNEKYDLKILGDITADKTQILMNDFFAKHEPKKQPVKVLIGSMGGEMVAVDMLWNAFDLIHLKGGTVNCFVPTVALSAAFYIFLLCDKKYAYEDATLMWHPIKSFVKQPTIYSAEQLQVLVDGLRQINTYIRGFVHQILVDIPEATIDTAFKEEKLWLAEDLCKLTKVITCVKRKSK